VTWRLVVVGTGTGVGKTWATTALATELAARSRRVVALKPVETGVTENTPGTDSHQLAAVSSLDVAPQPFRFEPPISPHLAARRVGCAITLPQILTYVQSHEPSSGSASHWTLIETAGGLFSPLAPGLTNFDLARALDPAIWLLVAPDALGVLHDVTATLGFARALGRTPNHVLLSAARAPDESTGTNATELEALGIVPRAFSACRDDAASLTPFVETLLSSPS
jgi:dethiobiotin synthetase